MENMSIPVMRDLTFNRCCCRRRTKTTTATNKTTKTPAATPAIITTFALIPLGANGLSTPTDGVLVCVVIDIISAEALDLRVKETVLVTLDDWLLVTTTVAVKLLVGAVSMVDVKEAMDVEVVVVVVVVVFKLVELVNI
jgi:hypothetical protein